MRERGFTLLEMMIVLVLAGLMLALVPPLFSGRTSTAELRATARELAAALRFARGQAITRQRETVLTLDTEHRHYTVSGRERSRRLPKGIGLKLITARSERIATHRAAIRFFPDGSATGGQITLSGGKQSYIVDINWLTGRVAIYNG
jgi:general secretion pathway protein H